MARKSRAQMLKFFVLAIGVADGIGIYIAHNRLSQPVTDKVQDESFAQAEIALPAVSSQQATSADKVSNFAVTEPKVEAREGKAATARVPSEAELAKIELPLPPMSSDIKARRAVQSDLPPMASNSREIKRSASAERPPVLPGVRTAGRHKTGGAVTYQSSLDLPNAYFEGSDTLPAARISAAQPHSRRVAPKSHRPEHSGGRGDTSFAEAFADDVSHAEVPDVAFAQGELPLVQPEPPSYSIEGAVGTQTLLSAAQGNDQSASDRRTSRPEPTLEVPFPAADTTSSLP